MKLKIPYNRFFCVIGMLLLSIGIISPEGRAAEMSAQEGWRHFPGFDNEPIRIIDTERYTYFLVAQKTYNTTYWSFTDPHLTLLRYDSATPEAGILPLSDFVKLNGTNVRWAEYSPEGKFLTVVYSDGGVDFVGDNGEVKHNAELKDRHVPGWIHTRSLTQSGTEAWITTDAGYIAIEGTTGNKIAEVTTGTAARQAVRSGSRTFLLKEGKLMVAAGNPRDIADFREIKSDDLSGEVLWLLPMGDGACGLLSSQSGTTALAVSVIKPEGEGWHVRGVRSLGIPQVGVAGQTGEYSMVAHQLERNCIRNRDGYLIYIWTDLCQFDITHGPDAENLFRYVSVSPSVSVAGSWDLSKAWTYRDRGRFIQGEAKWNSIKFGDESEAVRPMVPAVGHASKIAYAPGYGLAAVNYGLSTYWTNNGVIAPALVSLYDGERWTYPSGAYTRPEVTEKDEAMKSLYEKNRSRFPVPDPTGVVADPEYGDYMWISSTFGGLAAINLRKPDAAPFHFSHPKDPLAGFPGFRVVHPTYSWANFSAFTLPSFDGEGTYWTNNGVIAPALVSLYDGERWTYPSGAYTRPEVTEKDEAMKSLYEKNRSRFPVPDPTGVVADPEYGDYMWISSTFGGLAAINLRKPDAAPFHFSHPKDPLAGFPGFRVVHPTYSWANFSAFTLPSFDGEGTLWTLHSDYNAPKEGGSGLRLYYYTKATRRGMMESGNVKDSPDMPWISVPLKEQVSGHGLQCVALKHEKNRNRLAMFLRRKPFTLAIFDHKGTLPDETDDSFREIHQIRDQNGAVWAEPEVMCMAEDPLDGTVWVGTLLGLVGFNPESPTDGFTQPGKVLEIVDGDEIANPLAHITITDICFDAAGRMWVATEYGGLWCVSADRRRIEAHYTTENSPLPSDVVYAVGVDSGRNAVMVSTEAGITDFDMASSYYGGPESGAVVTPSEVKAGYGGNVVIRGLIPGSRISFRIAGEAVVATVTADEDGNAFWNLLDEEGNPVNPGIYVLEGAGRRLEIPVDR